MIRDVHPGSGSCFFPHPGSRIRGSQRHRIRIRNTAGNSLNILPSHRPPSFSMPLPPPPLASLQDNSNKTRARQRKTSPSLFPFLLKYNFLVCCQDTLSPRVTHLLCQSQKCSMANQVRTESSTCALYKAGVSIFKGIWSKGL